MGEAEVAGLVGFVLPVPVLLCCENIEPITSYFLVAPDGASRSIHDVEFLGAGVGRARRELGAHQGEEIAVRDGRVQEEFRRAPR